jgi:hypothetical protein
VHNLKRIFITFFLSLNAEDKVLYAKMVLTIVIFVINPFLYNISAVLNHNEMHSPFPVTLIDLINIPTLAFLLDFLLALKNFI